jgi:hypothetical protein
MNAIFFVLLRKTDLVVSRVTVQEGEHGAAIGGIDLLIYSREPKGILREVFAEIGIVDAHASINFILFEYKNRVRKTLETRYFPNETCCY